MLKSIVVAASIRSYTVIWVGGSYVYMYKLWIEKVIIRFSIPFSPLPDRYDCTLKTPVRSVVQTDSKSVFHTNLDTSPDRDPSDVVRTKQFGVPVEV